jgi:DNA (cytosine-5)-methyltransferase 1
MPNLQAKFDYVDLFAGIGGLSLPFKELGGNCVFASEWDRYAKVTYHANHGLIPHGDINELDISSIPKFDLLLAGFPCQPFSHAGLRMGFEDTRGTLFFTIASIIEAKRPKGVLLENVKGLITHDGGRTYNEILRVLSDELGYSVHAKVLNARDFGLPQNRERIYIAAFRDGLPFQFPEASHDRGEIKVGDILLPEEEVPSKYTISDKLWESHKARKVRHLERGNGFGFKLVNSTSSHTSTISARYGKDGSEILVSQENKNPRKLTPREAARLQGFPDYFKIPVSDTQAYKQFGNSVAVPVVRAIAHFLVGAITERPIDKTT